MVPPQYKDKLKAVLLEKGIGSLLPGNDPIDSLASNQDQYISDFVDALTAPPGKQLNGPNILLSAPLSTGQGSYREFSADPKYKNIGNQNYENALQLDESFRREQQIVLSTKPIQNQVESLVSSGKYVTPQKSLTYVTLSDGRVVQVVLEAVPNPIYVDLMKAKEAELGISRNYFSMNLGEQLTPTYYRKLQALIAYSQSLNQSGVTATI